MDDHVEPPLPPSERWSFPLLRLAVWAHYGFPFDIHLYPHFLWTYTPALELAVRVKSEAGGKRREIKGFSGL